MCAESVPGRLEETTFGAGRGSGVAWGSADRKVVAACAMQLEVYTVDCIAERWEIEIEPEVRDWPELLPFSLYRRVEDKTDRLLDEPTTLGEPYSRHLGGKLRELRFELEARPCASRTGSLPDRESFC